MQNLRDLCLYDYQWETECTDAGDIGLLKKTVYGTRDAASNWERDWQEHVKSWGCQLRLIWKNLFLQERHQVSGMTRGDGEHQSVELKVAARSQTCRHSRGRPRARERQLRAKHQHRMT